MNQNTKERIQILIVIVVTSILAQVVLFGAIGTTRAFMRHGDADPVPVAVPPRFVEESSSGLQFTLYRDTKTKRLYAYSGYGGLTEINDEPSTYEEVSK